MKSDYDRVESINAWKDRLLYSSTLITLILTFNEKAKVSDLTGFLNSYVDITIAINSMLVFVYIWLEIQGGNIFSKAERNRTLQYIDNSFDTNFGGKKIENYFTQDKLEPGFYKLSVNCFENTFHTFNIVKKMQFKTYAEAMFVMAVFMFSATYGEKGIARYLFEAILPLSLVQGAVRLAFFINRLDNLLEVFASFFTSLKNSEFKNREPEALKNVITYENTLSWASIPLESKIFFAMRNHLAEEWEKLKIEYKIN